MPWPKRAELPSGIQPLTSSHWLSVTVPQKSAIKLAVSEQGVHLVKGTNYCVLTASLLWVHTSRTASRATDLLTLLDSHCRCTVANSE